MELYLEILNDKEVNKMIDSINKIIKDTTPLCHGKRHALVVSKTMQTILEKLGYSTKIVELGMIAGLLHDIGCIDGKKDHAHKGSQVCKDILINKELSEEDIELICQAIYDHSTGEAIESTIGAALLIADKIDLDNSRLIESSNLDSNKWQSKLKDMNSVSIHIENNTITINYSANDNFDKDIFKNEWKKGILLPLKASEFLGCKCQFKINNIDY